MPKQGFITLFFDAEDFEREMDGLPLTDAMLFDFGKDLNDQAAHFLGYEGWVSGWNNLPDKPKTIEQYTQEAMNVEGTHECSLHFISDGTLRGIVAHKFSGTEFDVGFKEEMGEIAYYANDDDGTYYFGKSLTEALTKGYNAQKENA